MYYTPQDSSGTWRTASSPFLSFFPKNEWFPYLFNTMVNSRFKKYTTTVSGQGFITSLLAKNMQKNSRMSQGVMFHLHQNLKVKSIFNDQISNYYTLI